VREALAGRAPAPARWMLAPFLLVGAGLVGAVVYHLLALANPRPRLVLSEPAHVGGTHRVRYGFRGSSGRIRHLAIALVGAESATYTRGTDTVTDTEAFWRAELLDTTSPAEIHEGDLELRLPARTMGSFAARHNRIAWTLEVRGDIGFWPDVKDDLVLTVHPRPPGGDA
jgi:hypothetical protein